MFAFPVYGPAALVTTPRPDANVDAAVSQLAAVFDATAETHMPEYRDGRSEVRETLDNAVAEALSIDRWRFAGYADRLAAQPAVSQNGFENAIIAGQ